MASSSYPVLSVPSRPPCNYVNFLYSSSMCYLCCIASILLYFSSFLSWIRSYSFSFCFLASSSDFFLASISALFSPEPSAVNAFFSNSYASYRPTRASIASLCYIESSYLTASSCLALIAGFYLISFSYLSLA